MENNDILRTLERACDKLEMSRDAFARDFLNLDPAEFRRILKGERPLLMHSLFRLSERLNVNIADIGTGNLDLDAIIQNLRGNSGYIHPRYMVAAYSRKHTVLNALEYITRYRGQHIRYSVNRHFQIHDSFWTDAPDSPINLRFITDLWEYLKTLRFEAADYRALGFHSNHTLRNTPIDRALATRSSTTAVFELMFGDFLKNFEQNCEYRINKLQANRCVVDCHSRTEVAEALEVKHLGSLEGCQVKAGVLEGLPVFIGRSAARISETSCVHKGDTICRFVIEYEDSPLYKVREGHLRLLA